MSRRTRNILSYLDVQDEYTLVGDKIRTSFKEGSIAISYYRQKVDEETGYPLIPDDYSIITAITMYITMKYMGRLWYMGRKKDTQINIKNLNKIGNGIVNKLVINKWCYMV